jgi:hypothetical protein
MRKICLFVCLLAFAFNTEAQLKTPAPSSTQTIKQDFGLGSIELSYSRPGMKGRKIFGALVPYDKVWRTGANGATVITFSDEVTIGGTKIPAGKYGLFTIFNGDEATVIFNKTAEQWGAFKYKAEDDALRVKTKVTKASPAAEKLTFKVNPGSFGFVWGDKKVEVPVK